MMERGRQGWRKATLASGRKQKQAQEFQTLISSGSSSEFEISSEEEEGCATEAEGGEFCFDRKSCRKNLPTSTSTMTSLRLHLESKLRKTRKGGGRRRRSSERELGGTSKSCEKLVFEEGDEKMVEEEAGEEKVMVKPRKKVVREGSKSLDFQNMEGSKSLDFHNMRTFQCGIEDDLARLKLGNKKKKLKRNDFAVVDVNRADRDQ